MTVDVCNISAFSLTCIDSFHIMDTMREDKQWLNHIVDTMREDKQWLIHSMDTMREDKQ